MAKVRTTLTIDQDLMIRFQDVAEKERRSLSATVNGWLQQVIEPAEFVAAQIDGDRHASAQRLRSMMGAIQVVNDQADQVLQKARGGDRLRAPKAEPRSSEPVIPPPCNTGGKVPAKGHIVKSSRGSKS